MLILYNLLKRYVELPKEVTPEQVARDLTMATVEVESVKELGSELKDVVVGKVEKVEKHPNADKIKLAWVDIGKKENVKIVCGGTNLKEGLLVPVALPGSYVRWHGVGELVRLEKTKIRGEESYGMICAANEIGLYEVFPHKEMEITDLSRLNLKIGQSLAEALNLTGIVLDIDNKSLTNRPDLWGHYGISRELSAIYNVKLNNLDLGEKNNDKDYKLKIINYQSDVNNELEKISLDIKIKDQNLCSRYLGCVIENIEVGESPEWLKQELIATGHSIINNVVDITNYVMEETGQPLHTFDKEQISENNSGISQIVIRRAEKNEKLVLLDESELKLNKEMLVIANNKKSVALAGIMGGKDSGINAKTTTVILEAANFNAMNIRKTSQQLEVRSDSSMRFEKVLDVNLVEIGMRRALELFKEIFPTAKISPIIAEAGNWQNKNITIDIKHDFIIKRIGKDISAQEIKDILTKLGFQVEEKGNIYKIQVPSWRATGDVNIPEDIVEEVARIYGYDNLMSKVELIEMTEAKIQPVYELEDKIKNYLSLGVGMNEVLNYPWADERLMIEIGIIPNKECLVISNPPAPELKYLQSSLWPNLIKNIRDNLRYNDNFKIFELARVYNKELEPWDNQSKDNLPQQPKKLVGAVVSNKNDEVFLDVKGIVADINRYIPNIKCNFEKSNQVATFLDVSKVLDININKEKIGWLGEIDYAKLNFKGKKVALFEFDWNKLVASYKKTEQKKYKKILPFPMIERDLAVEINWEIKWSELVEVVRNIDKLIQQVEFLSEYPLQDKKSLAFRITYQAERTLTDEEINKIEKKILNKLEKKFNAELRK